MYDPNFPPTNAELESLPFRNQFQSLKALIDALQNISAAQVDGVNTVNPGDPAKVSVSVTGTTLHFTFDIPRGDEGVQGNDGIQGPPFASAVVDNVNTVDPGTPAAVSVSFDGTDVHFTFDIPRGDEGPPGADGAPGEVSSGDLATAIDSTSANTNGVSTLGLGVNDPPTQSEVQSIADKLDELINALRQ